ncbi:MAG: pseudouridine-5'-phosphate glycosidase [Proteobacteria bacterium]|jgi:pseudouridine-5'-phosphate glycosidase|nr:pseudouridine-5'-phosphate glycosidase [Pseudomonadota bacterium]MDA0850675.1 pseudouridine-5'-phosphate glycosidase [Pseudomonadota bacterium]MDA1294681.1 pseudouridine-5'-phosphate glycosidase [Pseudomonadota bacterium]
MTYLLSQEVKEALKNNSPVVALESTIITHGMPYPDNVAMARSVEDDIRAAGATPATIAVLNGQLHVGLNADQIEALSTATAPLKLSRADMALAMVSGKTGGTTVAGTMIAASLAGISVFATGGIGGVHRGAELTFDVSADLQELAQTPVTVVAAGAKAILDLPKTLEVLETFGVPVIAYGQDELPAFWSRTSGLKAPLRLDHPEEIAKAHHMRAQLGLSGGQLIANPIPKEDEIPRDVLTPLIEKAIREAEAKAITAKEVTPFLLKTILDLTNGKSLVANKALVRNNARLAAEIAKHI